MKAAIFDMDGTLLDSMGMWRGVLPRYFARLGLDDLATLNAEVEEMTFMQAAAHVSEKYGLLKTPQEIYKEMEDTIVQAYRTTVTLKPHVPEYLAQLAAEGMKMCIATLTDRSMAESVTKRLGIRDYFSFIITVREVGHSKDKPVIYQEAAARLEAARDDCRVYEDAPYAIRTAKDAGFEVYGLYDESQEYPAGFVETYCDKFVYSFAELLKHE